ncbi:glycosyltransferase family 4 protein [Marinifilum fragile]|uniref:glycosyltransferase family 4 protein n=1 Tax=Marinifilum fragile TaxID=570161 RepID=UPI002AA5FC24|nr:glycosyltransferase family 4 protein [Marinifilum fragile]
MTKEKKTLWVVSELFYPETTSTGYIMTEIAKELSSNCNVNVIAGPVSYDRIVAGTKALLGKNGEINIYRITGKGYDKNGLLNRLIGQLRISLGLMRLMLKHISSGSKVLIVTNPILLLYILSFFSQFKKWQVLLLVHDIFPDNLVPAGIIKKRSVIFNLLNTIFKRAYLKVNEFIVLGRDMSNYLQRKYPKVKVSIIENWAEIDLIPNPFINNNSYTEESKLSFLFAGNIGRLQGLSLLLECIKSVSKDDFNFNFIGEGAMKESLQSYCKVNQLRNVIFHGARPREEQNDFLNQCHIGVVSLAPGMYGMGVPSKFYNLLASGKAIFYIGDEDTELKYVIDQYENGWFAKAGDPCSINSVLHEIINSPKEDILKRGKSSRRLAEDIYSKDLILYKFTKLFNS